MKREILRIVNVYDDVSEETIKKYINELADKVNLDFMESFGEPRKLYFRIIVTDEDKE